VDPRCAAGDSFARHAPRQGRQHVLGRLRLQRGDASNRSVRDGTGPGDGRRELDQHAAQRIGGAGPAVSDER
jgi:hypothetical protein